MDDVSGERWPDTSDKQAYRAFEIVSQVWLGFPVRVRTYSCWDFNDKNHNLKVMYPSEIDSLLWRASFMKKSSRNSKIREKINKHRFKIRRGIDHEYERFRERKALKEFLKQRNGQ